MDDASTWKIVSKMVASKADVLAAAVEILNDEHESGLAAMVEQVETDLKRRYFAYAVNSLTGVAVPDEQ